MKRRIFAAALIMLVLVGMTACQKEGSPSSSSSTESQPAKADYTIASIAASPDWNSIATLPIDRVLWTDDTGIRAEGQLCHDEENLYVHMSAVEKDIRAENTEPMSPVYEDSCLEFFFMLEGENKYFNFEVNPNACLNIQIGPSKTDRINLVRSDAQEYFDIHANRTENGWEVYYTIPLEFIQYFYPDYSFAGDIMANMYKCGNKTVQKHYLSWMPIELDAPNFHCPEFFGRMHLE